MKRSLRLSSVTTGLLGIIAAFLLLAVLCIAVMPAPVAAQNKIADLGECMAESDCLGADPKVGGSANCTAKFCFTRTAKACPGNTGICYVQAPKQTLSVPIGNATVTDLAGYIQAIYDLAMGVAAVLAASMMMIGGFQYLTAGGDSSRVSAAKDRITGALIGLTLVSTAYLILNTVNPNLANLELPMIPVAKRQIFVGCEAISKCKPCGEEFDIKVKKGASGQVIPAADGDCKSVEFLPKGEGDVTCVGKGCDAASTAGKCDGLAQRCVAAGGGKTDQCGLLTAEQAATASWLCDSCKPAGASCDEKGTSDKCCGGFCSDGVCSGGEVGVECSSDDECKSGICGEETALFDGVCTSGVTGSPCFNDAQCTGGNLCVGDTGGGGNCLPGNLYNVCYDDNDCKTGECDGSVLSFLQGNTAGICIPSGGDAETCALGSCDSLNYCAQGVCTDGSAGSPCQTDSDCARTMIGEGGRSNAHCIEPGVSLMPPFCSDGSEGSYCDDDEDCSAGFCWTNGDLNVCVSGNLGSRCDDKCNAGLSCADGICFKQ